MPADLGEIDAALSAVSMQGARYPEHLQRAGWSLTAAPGELRKYYREQVQDITYGAMVK
jgi:hypothetical protein